MDNNIHINPESIGKFRAISDEPSPEGYESPITGYIGQFSHQIIEQRDNEIVARIGEQIEMDVDKNELIRALNYDRNQFNEGYRKGYRDAKEKYEEADRWISVKDKLPEKNDFVLVYDGSDMFVAWYENEGMSEGWHSYDVTYDGFPPIIAWRPLPKPYESEAENE